LFGLRWRGCPLPLVSGRGSPSGWLIYEAAFFLASFGPVLLLAAFLETAGWRQQPAEERFVPLPRFSPALFWLVDELAQNTCAGGQGDPCGIFQRIVTQSIHFL